ncbi:MAG: hypothetical protein E7B47_00225 [Streptococcus salivarius]|nr:hypothetical protein [Streptococcus salivarius]MDU3028203.1 hypothetical protein [Enterococcus faecalis]
MPKSYKTQLLERISDYRNQIEEIDQEVDQLVKESKKGFLAFLFEVKETLNEKTQWSGTQTLITPKGRETFRLLFI